jgi:oligopeptide/dipeptide ABC transporter ATP-binding protein
VMYLGRVVEQGAAESIYDAPLHPYTRALIAAIPEMDTGAAKPEALVAGEIPSPRNPPTGCHFHPRCPFAVEQCQTVEPVLEEVRPAQWVACHRWREVAAAPEGSAVSEGAEAPKEADDARHRPRPAGRGPWPERLQPPTDQDTMCAGTTVTMVRRSGQFSM